MTINAADYYRSLDDANAYFDNQLFATDWTSASDGDKEKALLAAARAINCVRYRGKKLPVFELLDADSNATQAEIEAADAKQIKQWPRDGDDFAPDIPATTQTLRQYATNPTAGTFTVTVTLGDGTTFTTSSIAFDATAATIESAIDAAATGVVSGWTNGDIAATSGPLTSADVVLTFSGNSVNKKAHSTRPVVTADATFLTDGALASPSGTANITGEVPDRVFFAQCEEAINLLAGRKPDQEFENLVLTSLGVSSTGRSADRSQMPPEHTAHFFTSATAWKYLLEFLDPANESFTLDRF